MRDSPLRSALSPRLRRLDFLPPWQAWALGLGGGLLAGAVLVGSAPRLVGTFAFLGLLAAAAALAWSGEPVAVAVTPKPSLVDLVPIPGGTFLMGSPESEEGRLFYEDPVHGVQISPFQCMRVPVTRRLYRQITGTDPGWPEGDADDRPVNNVSWLDAVKFCNQLSDREGLTPCYEMNKEDVIWQHAANGYRLLTEAEWEYACRAGSTTRWSFGDDEGALGDHAWYAENSSDELRPTGRKKPNAWALHDMHGNVFEWCWDRFGPYTEAASTDPSGPQEGLGRVLRGGAFFNSPRFLRSAYRFRNLPENRDRNVGFRCARGPRRQP
jgi:formylglycine-generating enzyme required for sulfatase activity